MTSITSHTQAANTNAMLSMPSLSSFSKKENTGKNFISYSLVSKNPSRRSASRLSFIDWDLNMNELEFE